MQCALGARWRTIAIDPPAHARNRAMRAWVVSRWAGSSNMLHMCPVADPGPTRASTLQASCSPFRLWFFAPPGSSVDFPALGCSSPFVLACDLPLPAHDVLHLAALLYELLLVHVLMEWRGGLCALHASVFSIGVSWLHDRHFFWSKELFPQPALVIGDDARNKLQSSCLHATARLLHISDGAFGNVSCASASRS